VKEPSTPIPFLIPEEELKALRRFGELLKPLDQSLELLTAYFLGLHKLASAIGLSSLGLDHDPQLYLSRLPLH